VGLFNFRSCYIIVYFVLRSAYEAWLCCEQTPIQDHVCYSFHWFVHDDRFSCHVRGNNFEFFVTWKDVNITLGWEVEVQYDYSSC
jgi:hypothetical protein